jgi:hypothetical protein
LEQSCKPIPRVRMPYDRRRRWLPSLRALLIHPRRRSVRRADDRQRIMLMDEYPENLLVLVSAVLVLSATDALLTLYLLNHGAHEVNPVMAYFLEKGPMIFMLVKYMLTAIGVTIVVIISDVFIPWLRIFTRDLLKVFVGMFAAVIAWQLFLAYCFVL